MTSAQRVVADLRSLAARTSTPDGAQRLAWGPVWREARSWFSEHVATMGLAISTDAAGNNWVTLPGESDETVIVGGHLDSVPNGGWLDGALGVMAGLGALRMFSGSRPPVTIAVVDWADEEGARFGRSLLGSSAASGSLQISEVEQLRDKTGVMLVDALRENGVDLDNALQARSRLADAAAYLELHIEQGPVLERLGLPLGAVLGTFGVERHAVRFTGQHAHAGSTPMDVRHDAFLAAARSALAFREDAQQRDDVRATTGIVKVSPGIVTAFNGTCELSLDQR